MNPIVFKVVHSCDVILEVLDVRDYQATRSIPLESLVAKFDKILIVLLNKCDLVPDAISAKAEVELRMQGLRVVRASAKERSGLRPLREQMMIALKRTGKEKITIGIIGYANTGKSSIISALKGKQSAAVSSVPGFTKGEQWVRLTDSLMLLDSPGIIPRDESPEELALKGSWSVTKLKDPESVAYALFGKLRGSGALTRKYGVEELAEADEQLDLLATKWNMLLKGGELDTNRAAKKVLQDYQRGELRM